MNLNYRIILSAICTSLVCLSSLTKANAQKQPIIAAPPLIGDSVKAGKLLTVVDTVHFDTQLKLKIATTNSLDNIVALYINEFTNKVFPDTFHVKVRIQVNYITGNNVSDSTVDSLQISYSKNNSYNSKAAKLYKDYYSVQVKVLDVTITGAADASVRPLLVMENLMVIDRLYIPNCTAVTAVSKNADSVSTTGELSVSWSGDPFIPMYDLEWTYIDSAALTAGNYNTPGGLLDPHLIFKNNSTRVRLNSTSYKIPLLYDGGGVLYFRVRPLQNAVDGEVISGTWSTELGANGLGSYGFHGHERKLNWQATSAYAEGGKWKAVIQYIDGSFRSRQTVTKDNSTGTTIVVETLFDNQGRPAIQVLPAPTLSKLIGYTPNFNVRGINSAEYDKSVYDTLINPNDYCDAGADSMGVANGAAKYYSPNNPLAGTAFHQYIPNAHGYAFSEIRYNRDNTGRMDRQGGVDSVFQIGKGHDTRYFYSSPQQKELDALFGTEVGDASHYSKNMVRDVNGQYSVTYVDMHGRTIATALAGANPASLERLSSYDSVTQTDELLTPVNNVIKDNSILSSKSILVPQRGAYTFHYSISPESLTLADCQQVNVCYDCLYDLTITINSNCNQQIIDCNNQQSSTGTRTITLRNFKLFKADSVTHSLDTTCTAANIIDTSVCLTLEEGSYDITKVLSISKESMEYYRDSLFIPHNTCKSFNEFVLEQLDSLRQHLVCTPDSAFTNLAVAYREQMLADLSPGGQYADNLNTISCFSIFSQNGNNQYWYQTVTGYKDEEGNPDLVNHYDGTEWVLFPPEQLTIDEFVNNFKSSWAETLLTLHPEYRLLVEYEKLKSAYGWEADFFQTETYASAVVKGFLNPTGSATLPASRFTVSGKTDSLFYALGISDPGIVNTAKQTLDNAIFNYLRKNQPPAFPQYYSLWGLATAAVKCNSNNTACVDSWNQTANVFNTDSLCAADLDIAWKVFRSQYLTIRENWIDNYAHQKSGVPFGFIHSPCYPVFPDMDISTVSIGQEYGGYNGTASDGTTAANNLNAFLLSNCQAYATRWMQELAPCGYTQADYDIIIPRLTQVAYEGADQDHPFGSSTVKPSSTYIYRSFDQVITEYNNLVYPGRNSVACNAYLIQNPKPYNQPGVIINLPIIAAPDSCTCSKINSLYLQFIADSSRYHTYSNYLKEVHGTTISQGSLDTLRSMCTVTSTCRYLAKPILLPPALQCGIADVCVDCNTVKILYDSFKVKFPGAIPTKMDPDTMRLINRVFANYMNHHLGFSKLAYEYLEFLETCSGQPSVNCDSTKWVVFNPGANLLINADLYANAVNNIPPYTQHFSNGYFVGPPVSKGTHYVLVNKKDTVKAPATTLIMQWRVKPGSNSPMADPFIRRGSLTTYVGAEWIRDPADTSWWIGSTILKAEDGDSVAGMGLQSNSHGLLADWVKIINPSTGDLRYFYDFTSGSICNSPGGPYLCGKQAVDSTITLNMNPCADSSILAVQGATYFFDLYLQHLKGEFERKYINKCLDAGKLESFTVVHPLTEYHYTLYYYDQAGNLVKTVPPEGVHYKRDSLWLDSVRIARSLRLPKVPSHTLATTYRYNSMSLAVSEHSPDGGLNRFWYDRLGRLVVSQNAKQSAEGNYSYLLYDESGRVTEAGQKKQLTAMTDAIARNQLALKNWLSYTYMLDGINIIAEQVMATAYDVKDQQVSASLTSGYIVNSSYQKPYTLRNRISYTRYYEKLRWNGSAARIEDYDNASIFSYDIHGNVDTFLQHYKTGIMQRHGINQFKLIAYHYDFITNKVNEVHYQPGLADQLYHRYEYDANNRLTDVYVVDRKQLLGIPVLEEHEARYSFYKHGSLARTVLGQQQVQGIDYAYTIEGWIKGINNDSLLDEDGKTGSLVAKDAYRSSINYFKRDYETIGSAVHNVFPDHTGFMNANIVDYKPVFNGNISSMVVSIPKLGETKLYNYGYDQLNRIIRMDAWNGYNTSQGIWNNLQKTEEYKERISYDANGNILTYLRNGNSSELAMDNLTYQYPKDANGNILNNRLRYVHDQAPDGNYPEDIDKQTALFLSLVQAEKQPELSSDNYQYDAIGNLIKDVKEGINNIDWTVYGKIRKITKTDGSIISYTYDVQGNRISKMISNNGDTTSTWYVRDVRGNTMSTYKGTSSSLTLIEHDLYGSNRLGVWNTSINADATPSASDYTFNRGNKLFELTNHLENILATVSDKKIGIDGNNNGTVDYFAPDVINAQDYYPGGMDMPGRSFIDGNKYRYGFNGKERDNEVVKYDYGFRIYDPRLMRFTSVDPLTKSFPWFTPYQFAANKPINSIDLDGLESIEMIYNIRVEPNGETKTQVTVHSYPKDSYGPQGKGILIKYEYDIRKLVKNPNSGKPGKPLAGFGKMLNLPDIDKSKSVEKFIAAPKEPGKKGLFERLDEWVQSLSVKEGEQGGGYFMTKPLEENAHQASADPNAPTARHTEVIDNAEALVGMIGGFGGDKGTVNASANGEGYEKLAAVAESLNAALERGKQIGEAVHIAKELLHEEKYEQCEGCGNFRKAGSDSVIQKPDSTKAGIIRKNVKMVKVPEFHKVD